MTRLPSLPGAPAAQRLAFRKMHGLGNDFVLLDLRDGDASLPTADLVRALADRNAGVGFDQLVGILPGGREWDAELRFWNSDGSEAGACGNGTRCAADLLMRQEGTDSVALRTRAGILRGERHSPADGSPEIDVDLGPPQLAWREIPLAEPRDTKSFEAPPGAADVSATASAVGMGNPHCVLFVPDVRSAPVARAGPAVETDPLFPEGVNVSFAEVRDRDRIGLRVWERGVGETRACGSAACATLVAAVRLGLARRSARVELEGGTLQVAWPEDDAGVRMRGAVTSVFEGVLDPDFALRHSAGEASA